MVPLRRLALLLALCMRMSLGGRTMLMAPGIQNTTHCDSEEWYAKRAIKHILGIERVPTSQFEDDLDYLTVSGCLDHQFRTYGWQTLAQHAVQRKDEDIIRSLNKRGADLRLALRTAVLDTSIAGTDRNRLTAFLLSIGASPKTTIGHDNKGRTLDTADEATLYMRYFFERARTLDVFKDREVLNKRLEKMARPPPEGAGMSFLPRLPECFFVLVGQLPAAQIVFDKVSAWAFRLAGRSKPLVLMFSGPSGHGKTELAQGLSVLLTGGRDHFLKVPCEQMKTATEMFGLGGAYQGAQQGSQLNNFIASHDGKTAVVLLDEVEKASHQVHESFLNIWDRGEWQDKKLTSFHQTRKIDCSKVLWILTTNAFDSQIKRFAKEHPELLRVRNEETLELEQMVDSQLRKDRQGEFADSFIGRIDSFVPFFPFLSGNELREQEVQVLIDTGLQEALDYHKDKDRNKHCSLELRLTPDSREEFADIAKTYFEPSEGARSVQRCINRFVNDPMETRWIRGDLPEKGGSLRMTVDKEKKTTAFRVE